MTDQQLVDQYFTYWNETDATARGAIIDQTFATEARYVDPLLEATGHAELHAIADGVHAQFPGHRFERTTAIDDHHDQLRFGWRLVAPDGAVTVEGVDIAQVADGRLATVTGFFGELGAAEADAA
jgi:hypothetical protein